MLRVEFACTEDSRERWIAELWEMGCAGITELDGGMRAFFAEAVEPTLRARLPEGATIEREPDFDWVATSRAQWKSIEVGERFFLVPEWRDDPTPAGRVRIPINPGLACGTGAHEATRLCLLAIERLLMPGDVVLDVGSGSGILSIAAGLLGASLVIACDEDPVAASIARDNLARAGVPHLLFTGSANAVASACVDLAVCNISAEAAGALATDIRRCLRPRGRGVVSGFETCDLPRLEIEYAGEIYKEGDWCAITFSR